MLKPAQTLVLDPAFAGMIANTSLLCAGSPTCSPQATI